MKNTKAKKARARETASLEVEQIKKAATVKRTLFVTREESFCYSHWLPGYNGKCANMHGHNGKVQITVVGNLFPYITDPKGDDITDPKGDAINGSAHIHFDRVKQAMVKDFSVLKREMKMAIELIDHSCLNDRLSVPTAEALVCWFVEMLEPVFGNCLVGIKVWETDNSFAEWRR